MSDSSCDLKFTMLDKNGNLLIFPKTKEDAHKIMLCDSLLNRRKKIDLSTNEKRKNDDRPKLVIFGLQLIYINNHALPIDLTCLKREY